jgi:hypothetical protein
MMACQELTEACLKNKEPTSLELEFVAVYEEVFKEEAAVKHVRALRKWHGDQNLAMRCRGQPKKQTQVDGGSWKKLAAACRGMTLRAIPARHKGHCCQGKGCTKNPEKMDIREETSGDTGRHHWNKEPRFKTTDTPEEGEDNWQWHQRTEQETEAMPGKQNNTWQGL